MEENPETRFSAAQAQELLLSCPLRLNQALLQQSERTQFVAECKNASAAADLDRRITDRNVLRGREPMVDLAGARKSPGFGFLQHLLDLAAAFDSDSVDPFAANPIVSHRQRIRADREIADHSIRVDNERHIGGCGQQAGGGLRVERTYGFVRFGKVGQRRSGRIRSAACFARGRMLAGLASPLSEGAGRQQLVVRLV